MSVFPVLRRSLHPFYFARTTSNEFTPTISEPGARSASLLRRFHFKTARRLVFERRGSHPPLPPKTHPKTHPKPTHWDITILEARRDPIMCRTGQHPTSFLPNTRRINGTSFGCVCSKVETVGRYVNTLRVCHVRASLPLGIFIMMRLPDFLIHA